MSIDLQGSKGAWLAWCGSVGLTPSEALRAVIARLKPGEWPAGSKGGAAVVAPANPSRGDGVSARPKVPLTDEEWRSVKGRADEEGMPVPRWIVALVRAHLTGRPQIGGPSLDRLRDSNLAVQAVGRNLNQIARALNAIADHLDHGRLSQAAQGLRAQPPDQVRLLLEEVKGVIEGHLPVVSAVLTDNVNRWRVKRGVLAARRLK